MFHPWTEGDARSEISREGMRVLEGCCGSSEIRGREWGWEGWGVGGPLFMAGSAPNECGEVRRADGAGRVGAIRRKASFEWKIKDLN